MSSIHRFAWVGLALVLLVPASCCRGKGGGGRSSGKWYQGGTLHQATAREWRAGSYADKLATAGDMLSATKWRGHLNTPEDFDRLKDKAAMLVGAVNDSLSGNSVESVRVSEIVASLVLLSSDYGP